MKKQSKPRLPKHQGGPRVGKCSRVSLLSGVNGYTTIHYKSVDEMIKDRVIDDVDEATVFAPNGEIGVFGSMQDALAWLNAMEDSNEPKNNS